MASQHIEINGTANRHNARLRSHIASVRRLRNDTAEIFEVFAQASSGQDWQGLADFLGISDAGDAEIIYNLFVGYKQAQDSIAAAISQYTDRLG